MIVITNESILNLLNEKNLNASIQQETQQITFIKTIEGINFPVYVRIFPKSHLIQFLTFMPLPFKKDCVNDLARFLLFINKELDVPGFGLDETNEVVFHRIMIPYVEDKVDGRILDNFIQSISLVCKTFAPAVVNLAVGKTTYQSIMEQINDSKNKVTS